MRTMQSPTCLVFGGTPKTSCCQRYPNAVKSLLYMYHSGMLWSTYVVRGASEGLQPLRDAG
jgi:hypothetical protein